jgi:hypothetical protein
MHVSIHFIINNSVNPNHLFFAQSAAKVFLGYGKGYGRKPPTMRNSNSGAARRGLRRVTVDRRNRRVGYLHERCLEPGQVSPAATERKWAEYQVAVYNDVARRLNGKDQGSGEYPKEILDAFNAPGVSPLALSQFNSTVVSAINQCIKARDLRRSCPGSHLEAGVTAKPVVADYFVSHLREQDYEPDPGLAFLTGQSGADAWPFNFFILLPVNDTESWYVRNLQPPIADQVLRYLQSRGTAANLEEMREFTVLQRIVMSTVVPPLFYRSLEEEKVVAAQRLPPACSWWHRLDTHFLRDSGLCPKIEEVQWLRCAIVVFGRTEGCGPHPSCSSLYSATRDH